MKRRFLSGLSLSLLILANGCGPASAPRPDAHDEPRPLTPAVSPSPQGADRYDLARDEERGGHTLKKHVGRSDPQLLERLERERSISAASTWVNLDTAEITVAEALRHQRQRIESWMHRGYPRANLALHYDAGRVIGRSLRRGDAVPVDCTDAVIVLRADGPDSFFVLTTYPEARE